jgi:hypothetical protein
MMEEYDEDHMVFGGFWNSVGFIILILLVFIFLWPVLLILLILHYIEDANMVRQPKREEDEEEYIESGMKFTKPAKKRKLKAKRKFIRKK